MKTKQMIPAMIALVALMVVTFSPMASAVDEVSADAVQDRLAVDTTDKAQVHFQGTTKGWAIIDGQSHVAEIEIDGNAIRNNKGIWRVTSDAEITAVDIHATLELKGKAANGKIKLHGTGTLDSGESFRIFLRGHYAPIFEEQGTFVMAFNAAKIQSTENGIHIPLIQSGIVNVEAVNSSTDDYNKFVEDFTRD